jgi:hypothetical protein
VNNELKVCAAAFFRNKGKEVVTANELIMTISLDLRWMDTTAASRFIKLIAAEGLVTATPDGLMKASPELAATDVPIAYRPSAELIEYIRTADTAVKKDAPAPETPKEEPKEAPKKKTPPANNDAILPKLMDAAVSSGMKRSEFMAECNKIVKRLNIDTEVAALLVLRDRGADVDHYYDAVYASVSKK